MHVRVGQKGVSIIDTNMFIKKKTFVSINLQLVLLFVFPFFMHGDILFFSSIVIQNL